MSVNNPGSNPGGVRIQRVTPIPAQNSRPVKEFQTFFQNADANGDGKLTQAELARYTNLAQLSAVLNRNGPDHKTFDQVGDINNVFVQHWGRFDTGKTGSITLADVNRVAGVDGKASDITVKDLGGEVIYHPHDP